MFFFQAVIGDACERHSGAFQGQLELDLIKQKYTACLHHMQTLKCIGFVPCNFGKMLLCVSKSVVPGSCQLGIPKWKLECLVWEQYFNGMQILPMFLAFSDYITIRQ